MPVIFKTYITDADGNYILDDDGNYIIDGSVTYDSVVAKADAFEGDYQVALLNTDGTLLDILTPKRIQTLTYSRILNDYGDFNITISGEDRAATYAQTVDLIVEIYRRNITGDILRLEGTYLSRYYNIFQDDNGQEWVIFAGFSLEHLLERRVIRPDDDPNAAGGFVTYAAAADSVMRSLVLYQAVTPNNDSGRTIPGLSVSPVDNIGYSWFVRTSYDNLLDVLKEGATKGKTDFWIERDSGATFTFYAGRIGTNRTATNNYPGSPFIQFDPRRMNMFNPNLTIDRKGEKTFCYVLGQGIEDERYVYPVSASQASDSPFNRVEVTTDARNEDNDTDGLNAAGIDVLNDEGRFIEFSFNPDMNAPQGKYNIDYFLGDYVTAVYKGYQTDLRIIKVSIEVTGDGESVTPTLTNEQTI